MRKLETPFNEKDILELKAGDQVRLTGTIYTARDKTHQRMVGDLSQGKPLPFKIDHQVIFYAGPAPTPPGRIIGSIGPTTSERMDVFTPVLLEHGLKGMIGKGDRGDDVKKAIKERRAVYFVTVGGAAAYLSNHVKKSEVLAYEELGTEAVHQLYVEDFPLVVAIDSSGRDIFEDASATYRDD